MRWKAKEHIYNFNVENKAQFRRPPDKKFRSLKQLC